MRFFDLILYFVFFIQHDYVVNIIKLKNKNQMFSFLLYLFLFFFSATNKFIVFNTHFVFLLHLLLLF